METVKKFCIPTNSLIQRVTHLFCFFFVVQTSYIIECNYSHWGIVLFFIYNTDNT